MTAPPSPAGAETPPATGPTRRWRRLARPLAAGLLALVLLVLAAVAGTIASLRTASGTAWWLQRLPGLVVDAPQGALLGDFAAASLGIALPGQRLELHDLRWRGLELGWSPVRGAWADVVLPELHIGRVMLQAEGQAPAAPASTLQPPRDLRLPVTLRIDALTVDSVQLPALGGTPLQGLVAQLALGADSGATHRLDLQALGWGQRSLQGTLQLGADGTLPLQGTLALTQSALATGNLRSPALAGTLQLNGFLTRFTAEARLGAAVAQTTPPTAPLLQARAVVQPFLPWPVSVLDARLNGLDLATFVPAAPRTALSGSATVRSVAPDQPATLRLDLANAQAGRWNEGQLPVRTLALAASARPDQPLQSAALQELVAELGNAKTTGGALELRGGSTATGWNLHLQLQRVQPSLLDARAPTFTLGGLVALEGTTTPGSDMAGTARLSSELTGLLDSAGLARSAPRDVAIRLAAQGSRQTDGALALQVDRAELQAGAARASLAGSVRHAGGAAAWQTRLDGTLGQFDPLLWWPGARPTALRPGSTRLNGTVQADFAWTPPPAATATTTTATPSATDWRALLAGYTGSATLALARSQLAGVPVLADLGLRREAGRAANATAVLSLAGNRLDLAARMATGTGNDDQATLKLQAPQLHTLQPLWALLPQAGAPTAATSQPAVGGQMEGHAALRGRWPLLTSEGALTARGLQAGSAALQQGELRWQLGTADNAPTQIDAQLTRLAVAGQTTETATLQLQGTTRAHTLALRANTRVVGRPGATGPAAAARSLSATLQLQGALQQGATSSWRGSVDQLAITEAGAPSAPWLQARAIGVAAQWSDALAALELQPGQVDFRVGPQASALRWTRMAWQQGRGPDAAGPTMDVQAQLDPVAVAPVLAWLQPGFGWSGDLQVGGRVVLRSDPAPVADIVLERTRGDLQITDDEGTQTLGLSDLRLALNASGGVWNFTQAVAGKSLGVAAGAVVARTAPGAHWPDAGTPVQGVVELRVANLDAWASWVPAGWRLGGSLQTSASIGGQLGAPELTGQLRGQALTVRNVLQGVNVTDGDVALALAGETVRVERFTAKAGNGTLTVTGNARLGASPSATLQLAADHFQVLGRVDLRVVASGQAQLRLAPDRVALDGQFAVDEGLIDFTKGDAPSLASDVVVVRTGPAPGTAPPPAPRPETARQLVLNLGLGLGEQLRLKGRGIDTRLAGDLRLTTPGGKLAVQGAVRTVGGSYDAYGQKLSIDRGVITFTGGVENPRLDIEATRPKTDIRVGVRVGGSALNPRVRLFSEPDLADVDKLSWLVLGRASSGLGRTDTALLQRAAVALFAGEEPGAVAKLTRAIGLDEISLRQTDGEVRETIVTLGKQISERLYVGYERGLNSTAGSFQLIYRIAQRFTLRGQTGADNAVDAIYTWRWK